jgi:hypothetical protein
MADESQRADGADPSGLLDSVVPDRRTFVKRVAIGAAFATPVVSSFSMSGVNSVFAQANGSPPGDGGNIGNGTNQTNSLAS